MAAKTTIRTRKIWTGDKGQGTYEVEAFRVLENGSDEKLPASATVTKQVNLITGGAPVEISWYSSSSADRSISAAKVMEGVIKAAIELAELLQ